MKKRILILPIISIFLLNGCGSSINYKDHLNDYVKEMEYHDGFNILQLTDIHWNSATQIGDETYGSKCYITKLINEVKNHIGEGNKIDLIEITGDMFMLSDHKEITEFIDFIDSFEIPYATVWGNHDRHGMYNPDWLSKQFKNAKYSLYTEVKNDNVAGRSNYVINLKIGSDVKWQIFNLDSGASYRKNATDFFLTYDYIRQNQLDWLTAEHQAIANDAPGICYYHIAQHDNDVAFDTKNYAKSAYFKLENFAASDYAMEMNETFKNNNIKGAFMGHAHAIDWTFTNNDGITYGLGVKTGGELYYGEVDTATAKEVIGEEVEFSLIGASLVTLNNDAGDFSLSHLYLNERDEGDFIKWVNY